MRKIKKHPSHKYFWVEDGELYETYETLRGFRFQFIMLVPDFPDKEPLEESDILAIEKEYRLF